MLNPISLIFHIKVNRRCPSTHTKERQAIPRLLSEFVPPFGVVFQVCGHYAKLECLVVESHICLTVCEDNPGGDSFRFDSDHLLHDTYGVLNFPVHIGLISFADHALYLLGKHRTSISFSLVDDGQLSASLE